MKHTQGPWKVMYSTSTKGECTLAVWPDNTIEGFIGSPICKVSPEENETEEDKANAKLIATAPELLKALEIIRDMFWTDGEPMHERIDDIKNFAKAAIKKATE